MTANARLLCYIFFKFVLQLPCKHHWEIQTISKNDFKASKELLNDKIRAREVRLIGDEGENFGLIATSKALEMAREKELDLVVVSPNQSPPVAKIMDWGKYKYETEKRAKEARKKQHTVDLKEVKMRYKIDTHDYLVRFKSAKKFLAAGDKVKVVIMLRGREMQHNKLAIELARKFVEELKTDDETMVIEKNPSLEGRNVVAVLAPGSNK